MRGGRDGRERWEGGTGGRNGRMGGREGGRERCDGTYEVGAYGMERVQNREPERSQVDLQPASQSMFYFDTFLFPACESHGSRRPN